MQLLQASMEEWDSKFTRGGEKVGQTLHIVGKAYFENEITIVNQVPSRWLGLCLRRVVPDPTTIYLHC